MDVLSPAKLLVILVVALVVLGPDKLPKMARQIGSLWSDFRSFRQRLESGVRDTFPDLPSTETITQVVRSPVAFLDNLADTHAAEQGNGNVANGTVSSAVEVEPTDSSGPDRVDAAGPVAPRISLADPDGVVHQIRAAGHLVPEDPGLN